VAEVNGQPAIVLRDGGTVSAVMVPEISDGRIVAVRTVVSPRKLAFAAAQLM
jgi:RNA polymerase sigma-70 factor (ECF subfamily)